MTRLSFTIAVATFVTGLWLGIVITELRFTPEPQIVFRDILPSPQFYDEGKRSEPGVLAPETLQAIELQSSREIFSNGRDPFVGGKP